VIRTFVTIVAKLHHSENQNARMVLYQQGHNGFSARMVTSNTVKTAIQDSGVC